MVTGTSGHWDEFVRRAKEYVDSGKLEIEEITYKVEMGRKLAAAREAVLAGAAGWAGLVKSGIAGNLIHHITQSRFRTWIDGFPDDALRALRAIWTRNDLPSADRIHAFSALFPASGTSREGHPVGVSGTGTRTTVASVLLMGLDIHEYPPFRVTVFDRAYERTGYERPEKGADEAALYEHALGFLDRFIKEAQARGLPLRDRLDAQSVVWGIKDEPPESDEKPEAGDDSPQPEPDLHALANDLHLTPEFLHEIDILLADKRQVIFQGPPGTGKTYVAQELANALRGRRGGSRSCNSTRPMPTRTSCKASALH